MTTDVSVCPRQAADLKVSIRGSAMVRPEVQEREDGALQVQCARTVSWNAGCRRLERQFPLAMLSTAARLPCIP